MSGALKPYPRYKESGVEWLGAVPEGWDSGRLKHIGTAIIGLTYTPADIVDGYVDDASTAVLRAGNIQSGEIDFADLVHVRSIIPEHLLLRKGDILICSRSGSRDLVGKCAQIDVTLDGFSFGAFTTVFRGSSVQRFVFYLLSSNLFAHQASAFMTTTINQLTIGVLNNVTIPLPPLPEQQAIADYLDAETERIDTLIAELREMIRLLKEKRQALISHCVTKGLDPTVPMKDSGVEWLGEVPEGWDIGRIKDAVEFIIDGPHFSPSYTEDGILFISARNIKVDRFDIDDAKFISDADYALFCKRVTPKNGDVLLTKGGTTGIARVADFYRPFQVWVHIAVLRPKEEIVSADFLAYSLNSTPGYSQSQLYTHGATNQDLGVTRIAKIFLALPPSDAQARITAHLDRETAKIDRLISETENTITLMQERRSALISSVVTGKLQVAGIAEPSGSTLNSRPESRS